MATLQLNTNRCTKIATTVLGLNNVKQSFIRQKQVSMNVQNRCTIAISNKMVVDEVNSQQLFWGRNNAITLFRPSAGVVVYCMLKLFC